MQADDARLLRGCLEGRRDAWDELVERYSPYVYFLIHATLRKHTRRSEDDLVEELHNDVFLALLENDMKRLRAFRGDNGCTLRSWLRIITINKTIDRLKAQRRMVSLDAEDGEGLRLLDSMADSSPTAEELMSELQAPASAEFIGQAVAELSPADHELYRLFFVEGLEAAEAAERLGISKGAVYTRKCRMIDRMSRVLKAEGRLGDHPGRERGHL
jgi:RNA polymerase sigma factor (sigma-70 family)